VYLFFNWCLRFGKIFFLLFNGWISNIFTKKNNSLRCHKWPDTSVKRRHVNCLDRDWPKVISLCGNHESHYLVIWWGFDRAVVRESAFYLRVREFDSCYGLMWKESVNPVPKVVGFLQVLRFPPTAWECWQGG
jgi:hypothetical protein